MFEAIRNVTSWLSLIAFVVAVIGAAARQYWVHRQRTLEAIPEKDRAAYALAVLDRFSLDTEGLTRVQRFELARDLLKQRAERFNKIVMVFTFSLAIGLAILAVAVIAPKLRAEEPSIGSLLDELPVTHPGQQQSVDLVREWAKRHPDFFEERGQPQLLKFVDIWSQTFSNGRVLYNATDNWVVVLFGESLTYLRFSKPAMTITYGPGNRQVNSELLAQLLQRIDDPEERAIYKSLVEDRKLMGGIGTVYIREDLRKKIGNPLASEFSRADALYGTGSGYNFVAGLRNDKKSTYENDLYIFDLVGDTFAKHTLLGWRWKPREGS